VNRTIAGAYGPDADAHLSSLASACAVQGSTATVAFEQLALAFTGSAPADPVTGVFCLIDGHVYNTAALAVELGLAPESSPEVVITCAWLAMGEEAFARLRGDHVIVLWHARERRGAVVRDQLDGRSVFIANHGGCLLFASETRELLRLLPTRPDVDRFALAHWLNGSGQPGDHTLFDKIRRLPAAHYIRLSEGRAQTRRYWCPEYRRPLGLPREDLAFGLRERLIRAVERRAGDDVGLLLSGGLDSSSVAAAGSRLSDPMLRPQSAYSAVFPRHPTIDESDIIDHLADAFGLDSVQLAVYRGSLFPGMWEYLSNWEIPPTSPNLFFWSRLFRRAAGDGLTALLDGEGGDELFGLSAYLLADRIRHGRLRSAWKLVYEIPGAGRNPSRASVRRHLDRFGIRGALPMAVQRARRARSDPSRYAHAWMHPDLADAFVESDNSWTWRAGPEPRWWKWLVYLTTDGVGPSLTRDHVRRRNTMAGIAPRHPLLDVDLIEYVLRLPPELAFDWRWSRPMLRQATEGILPDVARLRPDKSSFDAVFHEALSGPDLATVRRLLLGADAEIGAFVNKELLASELLDVPPERYAAGPVWWAIPVWRLTTAECFLRKQSDPDALAALIESRVGHATECSFSVRSAAAA
jgi:asparagine synthase (glutamine-hydrolysing)